MSLGAGFDLSFLDEKIHKIWIQRETDEKGRLLFNRPSLKTSQNPFRDSLELFKKRNKLFEKYFDETFVLKEGFRKGIPFEKKFFFHEAQKVGGILTLHSHHLKKLHFFYEKRKNWNIFFELRDDYFTKNEIKKILKIIPAQKILYSIRRFPFLLKKPFWNIDCDVEKISKKISSSIISSHGGFKTLPLLETYKKTHHLKFSPLIETWSDLLKGYKWWKKDPLKRSFLPRSSSARWDWFRLLMKHHMTLNFFKESLSSSDQPLLCDWLGLRDNLKGFGCVLGSPIKHSLSPAFHDSFFKKKSHVFLAIEVKEKELSSALKLLKELNMKAAAITSPLKKEALKYVKTKKEKSINTFVIYKQKLLGFNTDKEGFKDIKRKYGGKKMIFWGGFGLRETMKEMFQKSSFYSLRKKRCLQGSFHFKPTILIWAVGRDRMKISYFPLPSLKIKKIIDLNYTDDSPGKEYALKETISYEDGKRFFILQAKKQQEIWERYLKT